MSTDYTIHVGPYAVCKNEAAEHVVTKRACTNKKCGNKRTYHDLAVKFCSDCGSPIGNVESKQKGSKIDQHELMEELKEALIWPFGDQYWNWQKKNHVDIWVSNKSRKKAREWSFDPRETDFEPLGVTVDLVREEIIEFMEQFEKELGILRKHYGESNVEVKWGIMNTVH